MRKFQLLFFVLFGSGIINAQSIKGKLADPSDNKPLIGATLTLTSIKDSLSINKAVSDSKGDFLFQGHFFGFIFSESKFYRV